MAQTNFPLIVTDDLVFCYDANNTGKSWKGRPIVNQFAIPTPAANDNVTFSVQGTGTFQRVPANTVYGGYRVKDTDVVYRYNLGTNGCHYHGNDVTISAGVTATWSCDYYVDPTCTDYPVTNFLANFEGVVTGGASDPTPSIKGVWKRFTISSTAGSTGNCRMLLYPGGCSSSRLASNGFILFRNPQVEFSAPGNQPSPFVAGTRLDSGALLDLSKLRNTITLNSLTYTSTNNFTFNGSSDYITVGNISKPFSAFTVSVWINASTVADFKNPIDCNFSYNGTTGNIGPRLEMNSSGRLLWILSGDTGNNGNNNTYTVFSSGMQANRWYNVVITRTAGGLVSTYLNGEVVTNNAANSTGFVNVFSNVIIGKGFHLDSAVNRSFAGQIPIVLIYNKALLASEVKQNFNAHRGRYNL